MARYRVYRREWGTGVDPIQWNAVWSEAGVLRGVQSTSGTADYLTVPSGGPSVGLQDLRRGSPTEGLSATRRAGRERPAALVIPRGVAHGFYFHEPSLHVYAVSEFWNPDDELACHWADPSSGSTGPPLRPWFRTAIATPSRCRRCWPS